jgi:hypothetical protein
MAAMTQRENERKLAELDRLLNDPTTPLDAARVWALAAELRGKAPPPATTRVAPR